MSGGTALDRFITAVLAVRERDRSFSLGSVSPDCVTLVKRTTGYNLAGFERLLAVSEVRHVFKSHGDAKREAARNQKPVRKADFALVSTLVETAGAVELKGERRSNKPQRLVYRAQAGIDAFEYVETIHPDRRAVALKTMRKW